jgi:uncharacterized membrane protein
MRLPVRSESEAFRLAIASAAVIGLSVLIGWLTEPVIGAVLFGCIVVLAAVAYVRAENPDRRTALHDAAHERHPHGEATGMRHVLVVANQALTGDELRERITRVNGERVEVDVLVPVLASHLHYGVSDIDRELAQARIRLERSLAWAQQHGLVAHGAVGDPNPATALEDELRDFGADEVIVVTHARGRESWQEHGELGRLRRELDVPVTQLTVDEADGPATVGEPAADLPLDA